MSHELEPIPPVRILLDADGTFVQQLLGNTQSHLEDIERVYTGRAIEAYINELADAVTLHAPDDTSRELVKNSSLAVFHSIASSNIDRSHRNELLGHIQKEVDFPRALSRISGPAEQRKVATELAADGHSLHPEIKAVLEALSLDYLHSSDTQALPRKTIDTYLTIGGGITALSIDRTWLCMRKSIEDLVVAESSRDWQNMTVESFIG